MRIVLASHIGAMACRSLASALGHPHAQCSVGVFHMLMLGAHAHMRMWCPALAGVRDKYVPACLLCMTVLYMLHAVHMGD